MTKRQARLFFYFSTIGFAIIFIGMTIHSHTRFGELTNADKITAEVISGKDLWHRENCINCHTLLGEGAYFAPDLTKITQHRGTAYLTAFLKDPSQFYSDEKHRRLMPKPNLNDEEIDHVIAFLDWVSNIDNQGWPPRPILVSGGTFPGTSATAKAPPGEAAGTLTANAAKGEEIFRTTPAACFTCHSTAPGVNLAGPSLAGIVTEAERVLQDPEYQGKATDTAEYIRESIVEPSAYLVPGPMYSANGMSFMPSNYTEILTDEQIDLLVDFLLTLK